MYTCAPLAHVYSLKSLSSVRTNAHAHACIIMHGHVYLCTQEHINAKICSCKCCGFVRVHLRVHLMRHEQRHEVRKTCVCPLYYIFRVKCARPPCVWSSHARGLYICFTSKVQICAFFYAHRNPQLTMICWVAMHSCAHV